MKTIIRVASAVIVILGVAFLSVNKIAWAANPAETTGGPGSMKLVNGLWFAEFPNGALPQGCTAFLNDSPISTPFDVDPYPYHIGHSPHLHMVSTMTCGTTNCDYLFVDPVLVCYKTPSSGGAIFWLEPKLKQWVPFANFQTYPTFDGDLYTCVHSWVLGTFGFGYVVP